MIPARRDRLVQAVVGGLFAGGFLAAYLAVPFNPWLGGEGGLQMRPEPVVLPVSLLLGVPAVLGTAVGVLLHNLLFRLVPGGVTLAFGVAQAMVVAAGGLAALLVRNRLPRPYNNLAATWVLSLSLVLVLGAVAALEYDEGGFLVEADHILREVLLPVNVIGFLLLEVGDRWRDRAGGGPPLPEGTPREPPG